MSLTAVITGGLRGIGLGITKRIIETGKDNNVKTVIVTATSKDRSSADFEALKKSLTADAPQLAFYELQLTNDDSIAKFAADVKKEHAGVDILINNAGVISHPDTPKDKILSESILDVDQEAILFVEKVNTFGPLKLIQAFGPGMEEKKFGRIVNIASGAGQLNGMNSGMPPYRMSKVGLNVVTRIYADELNKKGLSNVKINSLCPGFIATDMTSVFGEGAATLKPDDVSNDILHFAYLGEDGPSGGFFRNKKTIEW
eukprot:TRINITY_DN352_c1_g1_i1.p1 TRINITY_DN352_c1_g1~~TRINITY_DN352_c1_g1_i1.p1  ORF type:complete len:270 (-),score=87.84 TRINITY_DN352_c1_g1_i1:120-890(-)